MARTVAQAKVNLWLRVLARETSGYHQLETLFCRLELGDDVAVRTNVRGRSLDCSGDAIPAGGLGAVERNLAWRAAVAYADATGWPSDWSIDVHKRIPVGGGLGGGSADAGAVLRCLNALAPAPLSAAALAALATTLGADVPFLTLGAPLALAWGRGERLLPLPPLPPHAVTLGCLPFGVATRDAYEWLDAAPGTPVPEAAIHDVARLGSWLEVARMASNDFEAPVASRHPEIARVLESFRAVADTSGDAASFALLAGSGSTVFLIAEHALGGDALGIAPARAVHTRTADRVVEVTVSD